MAKKICLSGIVVCLCAVCAGIAWVVQDPDAWQSMFLIFFGAVGVVAFALGLVVSAETEKMAKVLKSLEKFRFHDQPPEAELQFPLALAAGRWKLSLAENGLFLQVNPDTVFRLPCDASLTAIFRLSDPSGVEVGETDRFLRATLGPAEVDALRRWMERHPRTSPTAGDTVAASGVRSRLVPSPREGNPAGAAGNAREHPASYTSEKVKEVPPEEKGTPPRGGRVREPFSMTCLVANKAVSVSEKWERTWNPMQWGLFKKGSVHLEAGLLRVTRADDSGNEETLFLEPWEGVKEIAVRRVSKAEQLKSVLSLALLIGVGFAVVCMFGVIQNVGPEISSERYPLLILFGVAAVIVFGTLFVLLPGLLRTHPLDEIRVRTTGEGGIVFWVRTSSTDRLLKKLQSSGVTVIRHQVEQDGSL